MYGRRQEGYDVAKCSLCKGISFWLNREMIYPPAKSAAPPNVDLPPDIIQDYEEARDILQRSPRGAAALLRLCIQKLCMFLGEKGENINSDIASLVKKGLPEKVQRALDIVRVVGNNAVHPGQINLMDDPTSATRLFGLVNLIADVMITQPKHVEDLFEQIVPKSNKDAIAKRDHK